MTEIERYRKQRKQDNLSLLWAIIQSAILMGAVAWAIISLMGCGVVHEYVKEVYRTVGYIPQETGLVAIPQMTCTQNDHIDGEVKCEVFNYAPFTPKWIAYGEQTTFGDGAVFVFKVGSEKTLVEVGINIGTEVVYLRAYARRWTNGTIVFERWEEK